MTEGAGHSPTYEERVAELEAEGLTTSDAQGVADVEFGPLDLSRWATPQLALVQPLGKVDCE